MAAKKKTTAKKKSTAKKAPAKKTTAKKTTTTAKKKAPAKKAPAKKAATKKTTTVKKSAVKKTPTGARKATVSSEAGQFIPYTPEKGEDYMNDAQSAHFREILMNWKRELMEEVDRTVHHMQDEAANFPDPNDRATQESEFTMELRTRDRERKLIKKIDESLDNLENGEYGYCEQCGVEIGIQRLEARPTASLCIDCKSLDEIREKQRM